MTRPMKLGMPDRTLLVGVGAAVASLAAGVCAVALDAPAFGLLAGAAGIAAGSVAAALGARARFAADRAAEAEAEAARGRREVANLNAALSESRTAPPTPDTPAQTFDAATGLYDQPYFAVLTQQQVAAARRSLRPISVVIFEIDNLRGADAATRGQALTIVGDAVRRTLRESDAACRLGELMIGAVLEDTPETGGVWAAERVRGAILASPIGDTITLSAGVACYPTHALGAAELVSAAGRALEEARQRGSDRVEIAPEV
jgi:diguanylate cyclase (GGDEF)-like protein